MKSKKRLRRQIKLALIEALLANGYTIYPK